MSTGKFNPPFYEIMVIQPSIGMIWIQMKREGEWNII